MREKTARILLVAVCLALLFQLPAAAAGFPDVAKGAWYETYISQITSYNPDIIGGYEDGTFRPDGTVTRGEFLKMAAMASDCFTVVDDSCKVHWAAKYYKMARENGALTVDPSFGTLLFTCTPENLDKHITRSEMAVIVSNICDKLFRENRVTVTSPEQHITDYSSIGTAYRDAVVQAFGKGVLIGYGDGSFAPDGVLTRAEAATVIYRMLWSGDRKAPSFAYEEPLKIGTSDVTWTGGNVTNYVSFASRYKTMTDSERRLTLFGNANKTYFANSAEAAPYMTGVTVPVWRVDKSGNKYASSISLTVNKAVAQDVSLIFQDIYNDSEHFPICSWGGARYTDKLRHAWGCAIDLNADQNCYCRVANGTTSVLAGSGWWPGTNQFSFSSGCSVVRCFAKYGWGWGGQGYSGGYYDYMHFSILSSGG